MFQRSNWHRATAVIAALGMALTLCACGRKGPLDLPPGAASQAAPDQVVVGPDGTRVQKRPLPIDVLID